MACRKVALLQTFPARLSALVARSMATTTTPCPTDEAASELRTKTHTGQVFDEKDYRNVRFQTSVRVVNENWGINLIAEVPPQECTERVVSCDGGDGPLGHPKVYINLDKPGNHSCGYCGLRFVKKAGHHH